MCPVNFTKDHCILNKSQITKSKIPNNSKLQYQKSKQETARLRGDASVGFGSSLDILFRLLFLPVLFLFGIWMIGLLGFV